MSKNKRKLQLLAALTTLFLLAFLAACTGFFVNPTLTSLAIGPLTPTIVEGANEQMFATATYDDGSTKDVTGKVTWVSDNPTCAPITNPGGLIQAPSAVTSLCTSNVSASLQTTPAPATVVTITPGVPSQILLQASTMSPTVNSQVTFTATATFNGSTQDITSSVTWNNSDPTDLTLTNGSGVGALDGTVTAGTQITVSASFGGVNSNPITLTVTQ